MNILKKSIVVILIGAFIFSSFSFSANLSANEKADVLKGINIFKGDENGYNLTGKLRRSEAATFVVRLMGKENYVLANKSNFSSTSFSDVKINDWYTPYVSFCYTNGIIKGFPDGTFRPNDYISEKAFAQLILGVMGYKSGIDFEWDTIKRFMYENGLTEDISYTVSLDDNINYIRGNSVDLIYKSLTKKIKNSDKTVIDNLIDSKVTNIPVANKFGLIKVDEKKTKLEKVTVNSANKITISMNEEVILNADDISIYANEIRLDILSFETKGKDIIIEVSGEFYEGRDYRLEILKLYDKEDNLSEDFKKEFNGIEREEIESKYFKISKINLISPTMIEVYFTQPIDSSAETVLLYEFFKNGSLYFEGNYKTLEAKKMDGIDNGLVLISNSYNFEANNEYSLFVKGDLSSTYGANINMGEGDYYKFYGSTVKVEDIEVTDAYISEKDIVTVIFSEKFDYESAIDRDNYYLLDDSNKKYSPISVVVDKYDEDYSGRKINLRFTGIKTYKEYAIYIDDVKDVYDTSYVKNYREDLGPGEENSIHLSIDEIQAISRDLISIDFDIPLDEASDRAYITINNGIKIKSKLFVETEPNRLYIFLTKGTNLRDDKDYEITIKRGLKDAYGRSQSYELVDYVSGNSDLRDFINIENAYYISEDKIIVKFNNFIRKSDLEDVENYKFEYKKGSVSRTIFPIDANFVDYKTVVLTTDFISNEGKISVLADNLYDYSGQYKYTDIEETVDSKLE